MEPLDFDFLKNLYDFERQRKEQLTTALALPVGVGGRYRHAGYAGAEQDFFNQELRAHIIKAADRNTENNDTRSSLLYRARVWLFWLLGFATAAGIAYITAHVRFHA